MPEQYMDLQEMLSELHEESDGTAMSLSTQMNRHDHESAPQEQTEVTKPLETIVRNGQEKTRREVGREVIKIRDEVHKKTLSGLQQRIQAPCCARSDSNLEVRTESRLEF
eukprot:4706769-Amphidinium_carterae.1